jgi:3-oxoacyl-[acyl-carrier protein] reductase
MRLLEGQCAVITGAADGIGWVTAQVFARHGAKIVIGDIRGDAAEDRARQLADSGVEATGIACDVMTADDVTALVDHAIGTFGSLDVFVNNAGITRDASMGRMSLEDFQLVVDIHLRGAWLGTRAAVQAMRQSERHGSIINMSSISGKVGNPGQTNYSAAKAGMVGLTKAAAKEAARHGIRVNAIQPGLIRTEMTAKMQPHVLAAGLEQVPLGRIGEPEEVADVAVFLASRLSRYVTGAVIEVTGGRHM